MEKLLLLYELRMTFHEALQEIANLIGWKLLVLGGRRCTGLLATKAFRTIANPGSSFGDFQSCGTCLLLVVVHSYRGLAITVTMTAFLGSDSWFTASRNIFGGHRVIFCRYRRQIDKRDKHV